MILDLESYKEVFTNFFTIIINHSENAWYQLLLLSFIILVAFIIDYFISKIVVKSVNRFAHLTKATWDDILLNKNIIIHLCHMIAPILIYSFFDIALNESNWAYIFVKKLSLIYIVINAVRFGNGFLTAIYQVIINKEAFKDKPLKSILQIFIVCTWIAGIIVIISIIINKSPTKLLTTFGASAAIIMLIFKDTIIGFVSGIQLSANNMVSIGDWITVPKYDADGIVIDITINTVKVQNWDNTITTIPPYALISDSFQNWQGMTHSGARRIKRSINIDMKSVKFCTKEMLDKYKEIDLLKDYIENTEQKVEEYNETKVKNHTNPVNGRRQTNLGIFRAYLNLYLHENDTFRNDMTCMVRQLQPTEKGIPIEVYAFSKIQEWVQYENIQSDLFDHILAIIPNFDLSVYQAPSSDDLRSLSNIS